YEGPANGTLEQSVAGMSPATSQWITFTLTDLDVGKYDISLSIDPDNQVAEITECNNQATTTLLAPSDKVYLPLVFR
ncbi:MAG: CARDB domain-containing protein, partial [Anaerolineae bacterium]